MSQSGGCTVTPAVTLSVGQRITRALLNLLGRPVVRVNENSIGERELIGDSVKTLVPSVVRNVLINGNFDVWQRGGFTNVGGLPTALGISADSEYTADRWRASDPSGATTRQIYRGDFDLDQTIVPNSPSYYLRWSQTTGDTDPTLSQSIEDVRTMAGQSVTVSWWMRSNTSGTITCQMSQFFGGSPGQTRAIAATSGGSATVTGGAAWAQYEAHFDVPSLAGYSIGGTGATLSVGFTMPSASIFLTDFAQVQLEQSTVKTAFESHSYQYEYERCLRYFEYHGGIMAANPVQTVSIPIQLAAMTTAAADLVTNYVPGYPFKVRGISFVTTSIGVGGGAVQTINLEINATNVTGGVVTIDESGTATLGKLSNGTAVTAVNVGNATDTLSVEVAAGGTVFTDGHGVLLIKLENLTVSYAMRPMFYYSVRKYRAPTLTLFSANPGTGATFANLTPGEIGYSQDTANSVISAFVMKVDAEI